MGKITISEEIIGLQNYIEAMKKHETSKQKLEDLDNLMIHVNNLKDLVGITSDKTQDDCNLRVIVARFDIDRKDFYPIDAPELKERTRKRLIEIAECGMEEISFASFGYKGVMSGLYIEKVWVYSDEDFKNYMNWAKGLIAASLNGA